MLFSTPFARDLVGWSAPGNNVTEYVIRRRSAARTGGGRDENLSVPNELDTVARFNDRVTDYVLYRPGYPAEVIDTILDGLGAPDHLIGADIGAGTGISARLLADRGVRVVAVEPGAAMRQAAASHPHVAYVGGRAEATGLQTQSCDLVACFQSFHWFRASEALVEFARILRPRGRLAIVWNRRSTSDPLTAGYRQAIVDAGGEVAAEAMTFDPDVIADSGLFSPAERSSFANVQRLDLDGLIGRARSASYVPKTGPESERLLARLGALYAQHADATGVVAMVYETEVYRSFSL